MPTYSYPGIYVEEVQSGARSIEPVGTSTVGFIGVAPNPDARLHEAYAINNWTQFLKEYWVEGAASTPLSHAVYGFFQNGGSRCYIVNVGTKMELVGNGKQRKGIATLEEVDEVAIVAAPGFTDPASYDAILTHCELLGDRVAILDAPLNGDDFTIDQLGEIASTGTAKPPKKPAAGEAAAAEPTTPKGGLRARMSKGGYGALYFPWITISDPLAAKTLADVPPSGHIAGIYARTDATRGVHKAPANETVRGALDLTYNVTRAEQGVLNPKSVNCLRKFATQGILVWGARTLDDKESPWRYIPVRRFFNQCEESILEGTNWVVFEPNDRSLWKSIRRDITAFLMQQWRQGALMGATPEDAFFVKCDEETNPPEEIDAGKVTTIVGLAPVKPAEFVIFRIGQSASGAQIESEGGA
jgi:Bacteriophage tail sheath protein